MSGQDTLAFSGQSGSFVTAGLAEGTNSATIKTAASNGVGTDFGIDGIAYHYADTDNIAVTAHPIQAISTVCLYLVQITSGGTVSTKQGVITAVSSATNPSVGVQWPVPDADNCPLGGYKIVTNGSTTFTNGTTDIGAGGITETFYDFLGGMPLAPQLS